MHIMNCCSWIVWFGWLCCWSRRSSSSFRRRCEPWKWLSCREWVGGSGAHGAAFFLLPCPGMVCRGSQSWQPPESILLGLGRSVYSSSSMFCSAIPICKCSLNSTHYDVALLEPQLCTFLEKLSIRLVDWSVILPYACVMYVAGPKVALCAGPLIYALLKLEAEHHVKFTAIESSYIWR